MFRFDQKFRDEFRESWQVLLIATLALFFGFSAPAFSLPFIYPEVIREFGWTREQATLLASAKYMTGVFACLFFGRFLDIAGAWRALMVSVVVGGLALIAFAFVSGLPSYYAVGVLLGIAGPGAMVSSFVVVARSFRASQGTATGIVLLGGAIGGVVMPVVTQALIDAFGWRTGMVSLSTGIWLVAVPALVYGMVRVPLPDHRAKAGASEAVSVTAYFSGLMKGSAFWLMGIAFFLITVVDQALSQHQVLMFGDTGLSPADGALAVSAIGFVAIFGRLVAGNILDRSSNRGAAALYLSFTLAALLSLALETPLILIGYIVVRALALSIAMVDGPVISRHVYGTQHLGLLTGLFVAMANLGSATGPWLMGRMYETSGSYHSALVLFMILPAVAAACIWFVNPRMWKADRMAEAPPIPTAKASLNASFVSPPGRRPAHRGRYCRPKEPPRRCARNDPPIAQRHKRSRSAPPPPDGCPA
ncbi:nitrate/nitrite transporter NarK [Sphingosinicella soli]|uniref:Nitrate/nitrite transporter NarK n=1 Tax=Sphingosinicella soli TaxID=333708 RepID=A0A7W7AZA1_9SPHN|nr:nitrate/nitrite transporter NarK [Sphingosinicella soli]